MVSPSSGAAAAATSGAQVDAGRGLPASASETPGEATSALVWAVNRATPARDQPVHDGARAGRTPAPRGRPPAAAGGGRRPGRRPAPAPRRRPPAAGSTANSTRRTTCWPDRRTPARPRPTSSASRGSYSSSSTGDDLGQAGRGKIHPGKLPRRPSRPFLRNLHAQPLVVLWAREHGRATPRPPTSPSRTLAQHPRAHFSPNADSAERDRRDSPVEQADPQGLRVDRARARSGPQGAGGPRGAPAQAAGPRRRRPHRARRRRRHRRHRHRQQRQQGREAERQPAVTASGPRPRPRCRRGPRPPTPTPGRRPAGLSLLPERDAGPARPRAPRHLRATAKSPCPPTSASRAAPTPTGLTSLHTHDDSGVDPHRVASPASGSPSPRSSPSGTSTSRADQIGGLKAGS